LIDPQILHNSRHPNTERGSFLPTLTSAKRTHDSTMQQILGFLSGSGNSPSNPAQAWQKLDNFTSDVRQYMLPYGRNV
jgi:hypothetical protein